jgi:hypothetical protein
VIEREGFDGSRDVAVIFTAPSAMRETLRTAIALAGNLSATVTLVVPQVVPYPLPLDQSPKHSSFDEKRSRALAAWAPQVTAIQLCMGREADETIDSVLPPHSVVVIGGRRRWWRSRGERLARQLRRRGHDVLFAETE